MINLSKNIVMNKEFIERSTGKEITDRLAEIGLNVEEYDDNKKLVIYDFINEGYINITDNKIYKEDDIIDLYQNILVEDGEDFPLEYENVDQEPDYTMFNIAEENNYITDDLLSREENNYITDDLLSRDEYLQIDAEDYKKYIEMEAGNSYFVSDYTMIKEGY